jgi:crotonobetainyl-CoA:carnitine CoA-transferase CaiB-like acyl-CoA transferase
VAGALSDLLVVDLTRVLAGPYGTMVLSDFGARVIKIEQPGSGDETRQWGPPFTPEGESAYFLGVNRNKQSITLNLKTSAGREVLRDLVARADVLVENFKVGTMERLGCGYEAMRGLNPGLIYCAITGYGQTGPYRHRPGYDTVIEAQGGLMSITGPVDGEPFKVGVAVVDVTAGLYAATSILAALHHRVHTGEGQMIDIALFDTQLGWLVNVASGYLVSGEAPRRYGNAHGAIVPYGTVPTSDGLLMLAVGNDGQFRAMCGVLGHPEWGDDPRFATNPARVAQRDTLLPLLESEFRRHPTAEWVDPLLDAGVPCGPVNSIPQALADPQAEARAMVQSIGVADGHPLQMIGPVPKLSATPATITAPPPRLGQHTEEVLRDLLGYAPDQIERLRDGGAI